MCYIHDTKLAASLLLILYPHENEQTLYQSGLARLCYSNKHPSCLSGPYWFLTHSHYTSPYSAGSSADRFSHPPDPDKREATFASLGGTEEGAG